MLRIEEEKKTVERMIRLYCRKKEKNLSLCTECRELLEYTQQRLEHCPFGEKKSSCKYCPIHCYRQEMREKIKHVMKYAGPRMLWYHPRAALRHLLRK